MIKNLMHVHKYHHCQLGTLKKKSKTRDVCIKGGEEETVWLYNGLTVSSYGGKHLGDKQVKSCSTFKTEDSVWWH